jgi:hypothetical protein
MAVRLSIEKAENCSMCSTSVVSQHNDVKRMLVPGNSQVPSGQFQVLTYALRGIFTLLLQEGVIVPFLQGMNQVVFDT